MGAEAGVDARPFSLGSPESRAAVLCLHGLTGTPYEVRPLAEALAGAGLYAVGPALPGHGETPEALAAVPSFTAFTDAARGALDDLALRHEQVFVVGLSMGGLLALLLASERRVAGLVVVGVPLRLASPIRQLVPLIKRFVPFVAKRGGSDIQDAAARARHPSYDTMPLASVHELVKLQRVVRGRVRQVVAPILVAHGALDRTADPADARRIFDAVGSRERELLLLPSSGHVVPVDRDGRALAEATVGFIGRHAPGAR